VEEVLEEEELIDTGLLEDMVENYITRELGVREVVQKSERKLRKVRKATKTMQEKNEDVLVLRKL
jgi:hypothetical protein